MTRVLFSNAGHVPENVKKVLYGGAFQAKQAGVEAMTLIVTNKGTFANTYGGALGEPFAKKIQKGELPKIDGIKVRLESLRTLRFSAGSILVALHIAGDDMPIVDDLWEKKCIVYLPLTQVEGEAWQQKWNAFVLGANPQPAAREPNLPPQVVMRLKALTSQRNLANGFTDQRELEPTKKMLEELKAGGEAIRPVEIETWAARHGWSAKQAQELRNLAAKYVE